ncbi:unnamed protein product [Rotaria magnacalcarata]|uniref:FAD-binding PCMH-type domain-containing protein n=1 Tax=Rotaria magnacalcarata TaxID=392030 RepID=A0A816XE80_9BILA|nr:unnamed protein product [Rotaria magnacalcarata]CAF4305791.1 unnamed protein product [Rotaria magnacalcarata]
MMSHCEVYAAFFLITVIFNHHLAFTDRRCRCLSNDLNCWPNASVWQIFNSSIDGRLLIPRSSAAACKADHFDLVKCNETFYHWMDSSWRSDQVGAMQYFNWENVSCSIWNSSSICTQGSIPVLAVNATYYEHVQKTIQFAWTNNLRLVMKTSGHDLLGRSTAYGSLLLWLHYIKNVTLIPQYSSCGTTNVSNAVRACAGNTWGDVYTWLNTYNLTVLGGTSKSVGAAGGFIQGGGHSPLSRWRGMPTDQVLEYEVITADGMFRTVSPCQNGDLFWALSGGGPGTYAVVLSVVLRTFPSPYIVGTLQNIKAPNETRFAQLVRDFVRMLPSLADAGWAGYFSMVDTTMSMTFFWPNGNLTIANNTFNQFMNNNTDLLFTNPIIGDRPSFYQFSLDVLQNMESTGYNGLVGSRLIPETIVRNQPDAVAQVFFRIKGQSANGSQLNIAMVAGGQVSNASNTNNSINSAWRTALLHAYYAQGWSDDASIEIQQAIAAQITHQAQILDTLSNDTLFGCYMNEANPNEPNWQQRFFGSQAMYDRLKTVKDKYDPLGLFVCKNCVGSDDWTSDLNCPKISNSSSTANPSTTSTSTKMQNHSAPSTSIKFRIILQIILIKVYVLLC